MYIEDLILENFRCFASADMTLNHPERFYNESIPILKNVNLFLGDNGAGKSSIFKAAALAVIASVIQNSGFKPDYLIRRLDDSVKPLLEAYVFAWLKIEPTFDLLDSTAEHLSEDNFTSEAAIISRVSLTEQIHSKSIGISHKVMNYDDHHAFFLAGYGARRRTERPEGYSERNRSIRYQRIAGLFEDHVGLVPIAYGTLQLQKRKRFDEAKTLLNSLLPIDAGVSLTEEVDGFDAPFFDVRGAILPFTALSDGFRTFIAWVWDLCVQIARVAPTDIQLVDLPGVVIVDEIDLFLHPKWQREVVGQVARAFPKIQFLFSTHSPIVAGSLEPANIYVLETDADGAAVVKQYEENIFGLSTDQVLTSSYFDVDTPRAPEMESALQDLADKAGDGDVDAAREYLQLLRKGL